MEWIHSKSYNKVLYEIFHVDPKSKRVPFGLFKFIVSYIHKILLPAGGSAPYAADQDNENAGKVIVFSHGLGAHLNAYSAFCSNWASHGYIVVSVNHERDEVCVDYRGAATEEEPDKIRDYLFDKRNRDLKFRV